MFCWIKIQITQVIAFYKKLSLGMQKLKFLKVFWIKGINTWPLIFSLISFQMEWFFSNCCDGKIRSKNQQFQSMGFYSFIFWFAILKSCSNCEQKVFLIKKGKILQISKIWYLVIYTICPLERAFNRALLLFLGK